MQTHTDTYEHDGSTAVFAGLMVPTLRAAVEAFLWPCLLASGVKIVLWLVAIPSLCCEFGTPVKLLLAYLPVDLGFTVVFAIFNTQFAEDMCGAPGGGGAGATDEPPSCLRRAAH